MMNPRVTFNLLLGWCPGVKAAAKFMPDREVSNKRVAFSLALVVVVAATSYTLSDVILAWAGIPSVNLVKSFNDPVLGTRNGHTYLSFGQETETGSSAYTGPGYLQLGVYFAELLKNGTLANVVTIANVERGAGISQSLLLTKGNTWKLAHSFYLLHSISQSGYSPLYLVDSQDGSAWSHPVVAYGEPTQAITPTLLELDDGSLFLLFRSNRTWMYTIGRESIWSEPSPTPYGPGNGIDGEFQYESAFIDALGRVNVIWDEGSVYGNDQGLRYSTFINGFWSEPVIMSSNSVQLYGQQPRIFFSRIRGGYYLAVTTLLQTGSPEWHPVTTLYFSRDWMSWEELSYFDTWGYSLVELEDGGLARVIRDRGGHNLHYSQSLDGRNWSSGVPITVIVDEELTSDESAYQRSSFSYAISIVASLATLMALTKVVIIG
jgi:hypothetical protein